MEEPDVGEPPTVDPVATASVNDVVKYLKNVSICTFEEDIPCSAIDKVYLLDLAFMHHIIISNCKVDRHFY